MKKTISKFLLLSILCVPFMAKADMGAPTINDYEGVITTDRGVVCKDDKKKVIINKGDHVTVYGSVDRDGTIEYYVSTKDGLECDIKPNEFIPFDEEVRPTTENSSDLKTNNKIITNAEIIIRKGPDDLYEEVGKIPKGTTVYYRYTAYDPSGMESAFAYVEYNGLKGWIKTYTRDIINVSETAYRKYIAVFDTTTKCGVVPRNTILSVTKMYGNRDIILNYNNCEFDSDESNWKTIVAVSEFEEDGTFTKEAKIYEFADRKSKVLGKVDKGDTPKLLATYWDYDNNKLDIVYIEYKGIRGWVFESDANLKFPYEDDYPTTSTTTAAYKERTTKKPKALRKKRNTNMVIICSIVAGCLALTALVVIIIINKKKKGKVNKEEVKSEDTIKEVKMEETEETSEETSEEKTDDDKFEETEPEEIKEDTE